MNNNTWKYCPDNLTLDIGYYAVDLETCRTAAETLDWIFQVAGKMWASPEVLGNLILALDELLAPQSTLCSFGRSGMHLDVAKHLANHVTNQLK